jgi:hypothetical protein
MSIASLWLPILLSAAAVWIAGAVIWMALPHHQKDFGKLADDEGLRAYIKSAGIPPGNYGFPEFGSHAEANSPEGKKKMESGPVGMLSVWGPVSMGRNMLLTFLVNLVVSALIGYVGAAAIPPDSSFLHVFRVLGTVGILAWSFSFLPNGIWFQHTPRALAMNVIDGFAYGMITGLVFAALWPGA